MLRVDEGRASPFMVPSDSCEIPANPCGRCLLAREGGLSLEVPLVEAYTAAIKQEL